ncbi:MAG: GNAT family N-acetyltransferase [Rhodobacteraceae bacterium]|nr:GNAT family N-acetyltransferase [Paracoccaceae bacterium]
MIRMFYGHQLKSNAETGRHMFQSRARLFRGRLGWDVAVDSHGCERDEYDAFDPLYVVVIDEQDRHIGSLRILPTTGPNMTADHFAHLSGGGAIRSPLIWEVTRFCVESSDWIEESSVRRAGLELMLAAHELAEYAGVKQFLATFDRRMLTIYKRCGWEPDLLGFEGAGRQRVYLGLWDVEPEVGVNLRRKLRISDKIVEQEEMLQRLFAA